VLMIRSSILVKTCKLMHVFVTGLGFNRLRLQQ
jgi:hypothetical protein